jgi:ADP-dependent NAD(P)H-hydrate dehydratase
MTKREPAEPIDVTAAVLRDWPLPRPGSDKESRGRTLIVGGCEQTPGAVLLAAEAALRSGAGKLQVATVRSVATSLAVAVPEALVLPLAETAGGAIDASAADDVLELATDASAVLIGPGMSGEAETVAFMSALVPRLSAPLVIDALGLAYLTERLERVQHLRGRVVLTPNRRELAIMLGAALDDVETDARRAVTELAARTGATVTAGGPESWTASPRGQTWRDPSGGVGLGVSGSGDVFAGIVTGLCARGAEPEQAAVWASFLHGRAGDRLASNVGRVGFLAREVPAQVPLVLSEIEV